MDLANLPAFAAPPRTAPSHCRTSRLRLGGFLRPARRKVRGVIVAPPYPVKRFGTPDSPRRCPPPALSRKRERVHGTALSRKRERVRGKGPPPHAGEGPFHGNTGRGLPPRSRLRPSASRPRRRPPRSGAPARR